MARQKRLQPRGRQCMRDQGQPLVSRRRGAEIVRAAVTDFRLADMGADIRYCWAKYPTLKHMRPHAKLDPTKRRDLDRTFPWRA